MTQNWLKTTTPTPWRECETCCETLLLIANQGVVTYMSPVEAFATAIKFFDRRKMCSIA